MTRLLRILWVLARWRIDLFIDRTAVPLRLRLLLLPFSLFPVPNQPMAVCLRKALEELGPIFIKFGQMLSTRKDLLEPVLAAELARLQDSVPPFPAESAITIIERELGRPIEELFESFERKPLASASIAQVHSAVLKDGKSVVVKVVRPDIEPVIVQDMDLLLLLARLLYRFHPEGKRLRPVELVGDYRHTILDELDLQREASNTAQLRRNFLNSPLLYIPEVFWDYSSRNVLVMERIHGIPVTNVDELKSHHVNMQKLAERGLEIFFTQVFRDSFFHADMHPGNIFVNATDPENPQYIGIDCAIIGSLSEFDQYYLARNLLAIFHRDYRLVAELHVECGWVPPHTRATDFEAAIRSVCEPIFEKPLGEISFGHLLLYLFQTARRFDMAVQPSLILLQKTLLNVEGLGRQLYPELDLWSTAKPFLENWLRERYSPKSVFKQLERHLPGWLEQLPRIPDLVFERLNAPVSYPQESPPQELHEREALQKLLRRQEWLNMATLALLATVIFLLIR
jgi:ubiquinone biosynthesis protein